MRDLRDWAIGPPQGGGQTVIEDVLLYILSIILIFGVVFFWQWRGQEWVTVVLDGVAAWIRKHL
jgi:hypothetical protein